MSEEDVKIEALKELLLTKMEAYEQAIRLQAHEYERRLLILNGEADRLREMQATYLPREAFELINNRIQSEIKELCAFKDNMLGRMVIVPTAISLGVTVLVIFISRLIGV